MSARRPGRSQRGAEWRGVPSDETLQLAHALRSKLGAIKLCLEGAEHRAPAARDQAIALARLATQELSELIDEIAGTVRTAGAPSPAGRRARPGCRVLVVEDEYLLAQTVADHLGRAAFEVVGPVGTVEAALDLLQHGGIDCAVVDANLDGEFSSSVVLALHDRGIPAMILSGYDHAAMPADLKSLPFLQKPVNEPELVSMVAGLVP